MRLGLPPLSRSFSVSEAPAKPSLRPIWNSPLARPMLLNKAGIRCDPKKRIPMNARIASSVTPSVPAMDTRGGPTSQTLRNLKASPPEDGGKKAISDPSCNTRSNGAPMLPSAAILIPELPSKGISNLVIKSPMVEPNGSVTRLIRPLLPP